MLKLKEKLYLTIILCFKELCLSQHCPCQLSAGVSTGVAMSLTRHLKKISIFRRPSPHTNYKDSEVVT